MTTPKKTNGSRTFYPAMMIAALLAVAILVSSLGIVGYVVLVGAVCGMAATALLSSHFRLPPVFSLGLDAQDFDEPMVVKSSAPTQSPPNEFRGLRFELDERELTQYQRWRKAHDVKGRCPYYNDGLSAESPVGAIGGVRTFRFTPTSIGTTIVVSCACGAEVDLTDYGSW